MLPADHGTQDMTLSEHLHVYSIALADADADAAIVLQYKPMLGSVTCCLFMHRRSQVTACHCRVLLDQARNLSSPEGGYDSSQALILPIANKAPDC